MSYFNENEKQSVLRLYRQVLRACQDKLKQDDIKDIHQLLNLIIQKKIAQNTNDEPINLVIKSLNTMLLCAKEIGLGHATIMSIAIFEALKNDVISREEIKERYDIAINTIVNGLQKANELYTRSQAIETENFRKLLLSFAEDIRVVFILIAERTYVMRNIESFPQENQLKIANETSYLYAPLAHKLGLYKLKTELEDLSLRTLSPEIYSEIVQKLQETKEIREKYISDFITPLKKELHNAGFDFEIKGRTKSIYSIWNKIKKKNTPFEKIYDIFAIRIILDSKIEKEKAECWQVYSIVTDKYQPNPKRLRDWLSIPKSNGYESLHTTVMGPEGKWVEVQIRTKRMDEIAEKGLAAHWRYKGIKSEEGMDEWLKNIREILENPEKNAVDFIDDFKLDLYDDEVFVFTPTGELKKLRQGATILDLAFLIHSNLGCKCVGGKINGKNVTIRQTLNNGDQVEILTASNQTPKQDWLNIVVTSKARTKIKQALKENEAKQAEIGKESLVRRLKNWKIEYSDGDITRLSKHFGFKAVTDFYLAIAQERLDLIDLRNELLKSGQYENQNSIQQIKERRSADQFSQQGNITENTSNDDVLVIDQNLKGIEYKLAKCCNPIYGDEVFGFVSVNGGIKIHRTDCPNAPQMINRFGYRIVKAKWAGQSSTQYPIGLRVIGRDDIGIVTNITSLISKETDVSLRSITVNSKDGIFIGDIIVSVKNLSAFKQLCKKINAIKGVNQIIRN